MNEEYWYVFSTARSQIDGKFEVQCFLEIPPETVSKIPEFLLLKNDEIYKNCYNISEKEISEMFGLDSLAMNIEMLKHSANANNATRCLLKSECQMNRKILSTYVRTLSYEKVKEMRF